MAENPKMESSADPREISGFEEKFIAKKISDSDHVNGLRCTADSSDSFVVDMENLFHGGDKDITANSRIKLQRSVSRKGSQRSSEKKINSNTNANDRDSAVVGPSPIESCTPEKRPTVAVGTTDNLSSPLVHHHITITAGNITTVTDGRSILRRNSFKRPSSWILDPKKILFLFATLSSMGTILLIYLTLSTSKYSTDENGLDWQQQ